MVRVGPSVKGLSQKRQLKWPNHFFKPQWQGGERQPRPLNVLGPAASCQKGKGGNVPSLSCSTYLKGRCAARGIVKMSGRHQRWGPGLGCLWSVRRPNTGPGKNHSSTQSRCGEQKQPTGPHPKKPAPGARGRSWALGWEKPVPECVGVKTSAGELGTGVHANPQA